MRKSIIIAGVSALALAGVGAYIYFKGKKATTPNDSTTTPNNTTAPNNSTITPNSTTSATPSTTTGVSNSVADSSLGLNPITKTTSTVSNNDVIKTIEKDITTGITKTITTDIKSGKEVTTITKSDPTTISVRTITEEEKNKLQAVELATKIKTLNSMSSYVKPYNAGTLIAQYTKEINALGYKILPNFSIEKM
jgi:ethanolamine ammonia-lyase large subunit